MNNQSPYKLTEEQQKLGERAVQSIEINTQNLQAIIKKTPLFPLFEFLKAQMAINITTPVEAYFPTNDNLLDIAITGWTANIKTKEGYKTLYITYNQRTGILSLPAIPNITYKLNSFCKTVTPSATTSTIQPNTEGEMERTGKKSKYYFILNHDAQTKENSGQKNAERTILVYENDIAIANIPITTPNSLPKNQHLIN